jgi:hypothetical protein
VEDSRSELAGAVEKTGLTRGAQVSAVDREKAPRTKGVNQRRKRTSAITPTTLVGRAAWAGLWLRPAGEERLAGAGWAKGRVALKVGRAESEEVFLNQKLDFGTYQGFGNLHKEN